MNLRTSPSFLSLIRRTLPMALLCGAVLISSAPEAEARLAKVKNSVRLLQTEMALLQGTIETTLTDIASLKDMLTQQMAEAEKARTGEADQDEKILKNRKSLKKLIEKLKEDMAALKSLEARVAALEEGGGERGQLNKHVTLFADLRTRAEIATNLADFKSDSLDQEARYSQRTRVGLKLTPHEAVSIKFVAQDARLMGSGAAGQPIDVAAAPGAHPNRLDDEGLGVYQAYARLAPPKLAGLTLDIGRMPIVVGSGLLIGEDDWSLTGRSFDGIRVSYANDDVNVTAFYTMIEERLTPTAEDSELGGLVLSTDRIKEYVVPEIYALYMKDSAPYPIGRTLLTMGLRASGEPVKGFTYEAEAALQLGTVGVEHNGAICAHSGSVKRMATAYHVDLGYEVDTQLRPSFHAGLYAASGDGNPCDDRDVNFDPMFTDSYTHLDPMGLLRLSNLTMANIRASLQPFDFLTMELGFYAAFLTSTRGGVAGLGGLEYPVDELDKGIGNQVHFAVTYQRNDILQVRAGYGVFLPGGAVETQTTENWEHAHWAYTQARVLF